MAGETVYVLMMMEGGKKTPMWRPVSVVTDPAVAEQWGQYGKEVDWVPLELDDVSYLQPGRDEKKPLPSFQPGKISPIEQRAVETAQKLEETNARLLKIIERLQKQLGVRGKVKEQPEAQPAPAPAKKSSLLQKRKAS